MSDTDNSVELRMEAPRSAIDVIDAVSLARRMKRHELINEILAEYAEAKTREATAILRVTMDRSGGSGR